MVDILLYDPYLFAVCGMNFVCWIDSATGTVRSKYTHLDEDENLATLAWGYLYDLNSTDENGMEPEVYHSERPVSIVATGGFLGVIHLLNVAQRECYSFLEGHTDTIQELKFMPRSPNRLVSASEDGTLRMWHLGFPSQGQDTVNVCLMIFDSAYCCINAFDIDPLTEKYLVVGCDQRSSDDEAGGR